MTYAMRDSVLYDNRNRRIAFIRGQGIYNDDNQRVATMRENHLFDSNNRMMMSIRDLNIYYAGDTVVGLLTDAVKMIDGAEPGMLSVALWYCFIR
jgi:hypothetical protein